MKHFLFFLLLLPLSCNAQNGIFHLNRYESAERGAKNDLMKVEGAVTVTYLDENVAKSWHTWGTEGEIIPPELVRKNWTEAKCYDRECVVTIEEYNYVADPVDVIDLRSSVITPGTIRISDYDTTGFTFNWKICRRNGELIFKVTESGGVYDVNFRKPAMEYCDWFKKREGVEYCICGEPVAGKYTIRVFIGKAFEPWEIFSPICDCIASINQGNSDYDSIDTIEISEEPYILDRGGYGELVEIKYTGTLVVNYNDSDGAIQQERQSGGTVGYLNEQINRNWRCVLCKDCKVIIKNE